MKLDRGMYTLLAFIATMLKFIFYFGIPFCIVGVGTMLNLWDFSWGGVFTIYVLMRCYEEISTSMAILGIEKEEEDE